MGSAGILHSLTVAMIISKAMGGRRIAIPQYAIAATFNFTNSIEFLVDHPTLQNCVLL